MRKENKRLFWLTSAVILLPMFFGLLLWDRLPPSMPIHWGVTGEMDGTGPRFFVVFLLPVIFLALHWFGLWITGLDPKHKGMGKKPTRLIFWVIPVLSLVVNGILYAISLGLQPDIKTVLGILFGILFVVVGNLMPKIKQNHSLGIKLSWTLSSEANWNATHRFAGRVWVIAGLVLLALVPFPGIPLWLSPMGTLLMAAVLPMVYSYLFYRKEKREGLLPVGQSARRSRILGGVVGVLIVGIAAYASFFLGEIEICYEADSLTVDSNVSSGITVAYADIDRLDYRENMEYGDRVIGFGSFKLLVGSFENQEFGRYTLYAYSDCSAAVIVESEGKILVLNGKSVAETQALYEEILHHWMGETI